MTNNKFSVTRKTENGKRKTEKTENWGLLIYIVNSTNKKTQKYKHMSVLSELKQDLQRIGESVYSETSQKPGRDEYGNQLLGGIGSEGIADATYLASSARIIQRGKRRRPQGYWQTRMTTSGLNYSQEMQAEAMLNVADPTADVADMVLDDEADDAEAFAKKLDDRMEQRIDGYKNSMTATSGSNDLYQIESRMDRIKDRLKSELV